MKTRNSLAFLGFSVIMVFFANLANGQILNRIIKPEEAQNHGVEISRVNSLSDYLLSNVDVQQLLKEDSLEKSQGKPFRFGKAIDVNIDFIKMATKVKSQDTTLMFYKFTSKEAFSINLVFDKFFLASNASLLIYNSDRSMVYGPINKDNNPDNGVFWSDLVKGENIIIQLTIIGEDTEETQIHIDKVVHGYRNTFAGFGQSADCNRDIACPEGNVWRNEGNSVAMLLLDDGTRFCSGSLLNNVCQDLTPNFLTAFHCLDLNQNGDLVDAERNQVNNWVFRFLYESPNCGGGDDAVFQSINGSTFRAAFQPTDFALLLLNNRPTGDVTYAGWSRANVAATSAVAIHHPAGDVKKISIDNNPITNIGVITTWVRDGFGNPLVQCPPNTHWNTIFDSPVVGIDPSTVQHGSSGSPIFDQNHRIVGQLHGDHLYRVGDNFCDNIRGDYGRFDVSWAGGGTDATRLSNWLDPNNTEALTTNTILIPTILGLDILCSTNSYTLQNPPAGSTVTWSASPAGVVSISGSGTSVNLTPVSHGQVTLTATLTTDCGTVPVEKTIHAAAGPIPTSSISLEPLESSPYVCPGQTFTLYPGPNLPWYQYEVSVTNGYHTEVSHGFYWIHFNNYTPSPPYFDAAVSVRIHNGCAWSEWKSVNLYTEPSCAGSGGCELCFLSYPNPSDNELTIQWNPVEGEKNNMEFSPYEMSLYDSKGQEVYSGTINREKVSIDTRKLKNGFYYLHIRYKEGLIRRQIRVER